MLCRLCVVSCCEPQLQALEQSIPLENFPKSVIEVYALVLEESGGALRYIENTDTKSTGKYVFA